MSLRIHHLAAGYPRRPVLTGVDLPPITPGTVVAVLGPNAVGKSTLLRSVAGLRGYTGRVELNGQDLATTPTRARLRQVGYLPQTLPQASSLLAYEVLEISLRANRGDWSADRRATAIEDVVQLLGIQTLALRRLDELSGGQRQMVGLAQVIVRAPQLMLLDEPTSALDLRWQLHVLQTVVTLAQRQGLIAMVALHDLNLALRFCQQALVLGSGCAQAVGAPSAVLTSELIARVWGVQATLERSVSGRPILMAEAALPTDLDLNR